MPPGPVQSEALKYLQQNADPVMGNVLQAVQLDERTLAENLLARVSKRILVVHLEDHKNSIDHTLAGFAKVHRRLREEVDFADLKIMEVIQRTVWVKLDDPGAAGAMEHVVHSLSQDVCRQFIGNETGYLIDAMKTEVSLRSDGFVSFMWKQKFGAA